MKRIKFISLCCLFLIVMASFNSCQRGSDTEKFVVRGISERIDSVCQVFLSKGNTVGFSVVIAKDDSIIFSKGYGLANIASKKPGTENTIYAIASISKFITAITTMKMVEQGKLQLEDKVSDYISNFPQQRFMDEITIEHLLRHQSGLVDHEDWFDSLYINEGRVFQEEEFFTFLNRPLFFRPGSQYSYSNSGYAVLSAILEKVSGRSFHNLIVENISNPLGLSSVGMWHKNWNLEQASMSYELTETGVDTSFHMMTKAMKGDGGLSASVIDLLKLGIKLSDHEIVSERSLKKILSPTQLDQITIDYGLGVKMGEYAEQPTWGHSGGYKGTGWAILSHYPESGHTFAAAINTNYSPEEVWTLRHFIMPIVLGIERPTYNSTQIEDPEQFAGTYRKIDRWGQGKPSLRILTVKDGGLIWDNPDTEAPGAHLFPIGEDRFSWEAYPFDEFKFHRVDGKVVACSEYNDGFFVSVRTKVPEKE